MAKRRQMPTGGLGNATPAGLAAAGMLMQAGDSTYAGMMDQSNSAASPARTVAASKLEQLPAMVQGVMGHDPAVQTECTTQFRRLLSIEKNPPNFYRDLGLVMTYTTLGREAEARTVLERLVAVEGGQRPAWIAEAFAWRGDKEKAFEWLEKAYAQKDIGLAYLLNSRVLETLSDDPRWIELLRKLELLDYWQAMPAAYGGPAKPVG